MVIAESQKLSLELEGIELIGAKIFVKSLPNLKNNSKVNNNIIHKEDGHSKDIGIIKTYSPGIHEYFIIFQDLSILPKWLKRYSPNNNKNIQKTIETFELVLGWDEKSENLTQSILNTVGTNTNPIEHDNDSSTSRKRRKKKLDDQEILSSANFSDNQKQNGENLLNGLENQQESDLLNGHSVNVNNSDSVDNNNNQNNNFNGVNNNKNEDINVNDDDHNSGEDNDNNDSNNDSDDDNFLIDNDDNIIPNDIENHVDDFETNGLDNNNDNINHLNEDDNTDNTSQLICGLCQRGKFLGQEVITCSCCENHHYHLQCMSSTTINLPLVDPWRCWNCICK